MRILSLYDSDKDNAIVVDVCEHFAYDEEQSEEILSYLTSSDHSHSICCGRITPEYDPITGEPFQNSNGGGYTDGAYYWSDSLVEFFSMYHNRLPEEFLRHMGLLD